MPELNRKITSLSRNPAERVLSLYPLEGRPILLASRPKDGANFDFQLGETDMVRSDLSDSNDSLANQIAPVVCSEGKWRLGGLIAYLHREYTWLRERIPTLPQNLPSHCVDPLQIARFLVEDIRGFDWHGPDASQVMAAIKRIEQKLEGGSIRKSAVDTASQMLTTKEVSNLIGCSYSQARALMLDGRIKSMKDGRLLRSRREWVEEYLLAQVVKKPEPQPEEIKTKRPKAKLVGQFKKGGLAYEFLRSRPD